MKYGKSEVETLSHRFASLAVLPRETIWYLTNWGYRKGMGGKDSPQFKLAMHICKTEWRKLFPSYEPLSGIKVNEYVKQKAVPV